MKVLFLCTGNSCRSQMAEGWCRRLFGETGVQAFSAGTSPSSLDPLAVEVMAEAGVDISGHRSKHLESIDCTDFDLVVTVCDSARESCPVFPAAVRTIHRSFDDPPRLARKAASKAEVLDVYRRVRDEIRVFVESLPALIEESRSDPAGSG